MRKNLLVSGLKPTRHTPHKSEFPVESWRQSPYDVIIVNSDKPVGDAMKPSEALQAHRASIRSIVEAHRARNARVFGSVIHGDDTDDSDLDILIDPTPDTTMMDIGAIRHELRKLLGVPVDVLTPKALPDSFRAQVIAEAVPV